MELPLEFGERERDCEVAESTLDERFEDFHVEHPWVYEALEHLTVQWVAAGGGRIGVKALFEQLRWLSPDLANGVPIQLNNNFTSRYARLLRASHPEWREVFELRRLRSDDPKARRSTLDGECQVK
ncbi:hypothetical protein [Streptomyces sp. AK08-02]|uniref:hypothetical protein n=1 Tax=Streptomyces sp. AK08-02 TaxID=3028654 RepID=UPI0029B698CF|nr:hypothetical protein [Streptomyces sp. AK08-02]MDX3749638.1 hypothetical protein [Streptomyces sp. AK08-02]